LVFAGVSYTELHDTQNFKYSMIATIEESLEMAGLIVFIWALLKYCADKYKEVLFRFEVERKNKSRVRFRQEPSQKVLLEDLK
jgi:hypothetical protein